MAEKKAQKKPAEITQENLDESFEVEYMSRWKLLVRAFRKHRAGRISLVILLILYVLMLFADFFSPANPYQQYTDRTFAPPSEVHWKYEDKLVAPYIYDVMSYRDPVTYQRIYEPASVIENFVGTDTDGNAVNYKLGEDGVTAISLIFTSNINAIGSKRERSLKKSTEEMEMIPLSKIDMMKEGGRKETITDQATLKTYIEDPIYSYKIARIGDLQSVEIEEGVNAVNIIYEDGTEKEVSLSALNTIDLKRFTIKWFVRGWEYKLFGFIPMDIHLFGVDSPAQYYIFGADAYGRDVLTRILFGSQVSLTVGFAGILITFTLGLFLGGVAGYYGGWVDEVLMRATEILMSIPSLYLLISLRAILPADLPSNITYLMIIVILSFIGWPGMSRVIRGMVLSIKQSEYVEAARAMGYPTGRIIWKHIIPNTSTYIIVSATLSIPGYILGEAGLSFLGYGIREPQSSWGLMLAQAQKLSVLEQYPWLLLPGVFLFVAILAFNLFGDAMRDAMDPRALGH